MKFWKRFGALALSAALCLPLLTGCDKETPVEEDRTLDVSVGSSPVSLDPRRIRPFWSICTKI